MTHAKRKLYRLADQLRSRVQGLQRQSTHSIQAELDSLLPRLQRIQTVRHRLHLCQRFRLSHAAERVCADLLNQVGDLSCDMNHLNQLIARENRRPRAVLSLRDLVQDLEQLEEEFGEWEYDSNAHVLSVTTEDIQLEGVFLGPFTVRLMLDHLDDGRRGCYDVVATDPHPPTRNENVTHPHVSDDRLCEGNAGAAIHAALQAGRFCDFFMLVHSVLTTYNPDSPYVKLEHWEGEPCKDCGSIMSEDERYYCEGCENNFCSGCISYCRGCELSMCGECLSECHACNERVCSECLKTCTECRESCCRVCLNEDGLCASCQETQEQENEDESSENETPGTPENSLGSEDPRIEPVTSERRDNDSSTAEQPSRCFEPVAAIANLGAESNGAEQA